VDDAPPTAAALSRLELGILIVLLSMGVAGLVGLIAVLDADSDFAAIGIGFGVALLIFQTGGTIVCGLACLARGRVEALSIGALVAAGISIDMFVLAIWLEIDNETYAKIAGIAFIVAVFGLLTLGLTLACQPRDALARSLYLGAVLASLLGAVLATVLIITTGDNDFVSSAGLYSPVPVDFTNDSLLRPLAAVLVVLAALWFAAVAASRVVKEKPPSHVEADV
jgi:hypothetical protein